MQAQNPYLAQMTSNTQDQDIRDRLPSEWPIEQLGLTTDHSSSVPISQQDVSGIADAKVFDGLFSAAECEAIITSLDRKSAWKAANPNKRLRDCDRQVVVSSSLADLVMKRLQFTSALPDSMLSRRVTKATSLTSAGAGAAEIGTEGVWKLSRVNEVFRAASYGQGGHFSPHRDGMILPTPLERSFFSVIIYLTDAGFDGGETAFVKDGDGFALEAGHFDPALHIVAKVAPKVGRCLVFPQNTLHAGSPVVLRSGDGGSGDASGRKVIFVSELFFERVETLPEEECWNPEAVALLRQAQKLEEDGDFQGSIRAYSRLRFLDPEFSAFVGVP